MDSNMSCGRGPQPARRPRQDAPPMRPTRRVAHKSPISKRCRRRSASSCAFCERGIARARSDLPVKPLGARRLPQQRAQSGCKGLRRACAEQAGAHGRGTGFEGSKPAAHLSKPSKTPNSLVTQGGNEPPTTQQAGWPPTRGKVRYMVRIRRSAISASYIQSEGTCTH